MLFKVFRRKARRGFAKAENNPDRQVADELPFVNTSSLEHGLDEGLLRACRLHMELMTKAHVDNRFRAALQEFKQALWQKLLWHLQAFRDKISRW